MNTIKNEVATIHNFSDINEFLDIAEKNPIECGSEKWKFSDNPECNTKNRSYKLLRAGRGLSDVRKISRKYRDEFKSLNLGKLADRTKSIKRRRRFNDFDGNLDFDRVMVGDVNYWEKVERNGQSQIVRIGINFALSHQNKIEDFSRVVALSCIFAEILESLGYGIEVYATSIGKLERHRRKKDHSFLGFCFPVKKASEPLDFDRIYSLGIPALLRDAQFKVEHSIYNDFGGHSIIPPMDVLKLADVDLMIEKSWTENGKQIEKITKVIESL